MITSGIERILISVRDMDESLAFFRDIAGMFVVADHDLDSLKIKHLWDLPEGTRARAVFLKNQEQPTLLELIQFDLYSGRFIRERAQTWDYGIYDIALSVKDLEKTYKRLRDKSFTFFTPPTLYSPTFFPDLLVKFSVCLGPNEIPIPHIQSITPPPPYEMQHDYGTIIDSAQMVEDIEQALRFYRDILGLTVVTDATFPKGLLDKIMRFPDGTEGRIALLNKQGSKAPFIELIQVSVKGRFLCDVSRSPNLGIFMISFETDNISRLIKKFNKEEVKIISGPVEMKVAPHGMVYMIIVEAPSKVMVEFFEKKK